MKLYLDTGNIDEIRELASTGMVDGVTTNPTLIAKEGKDFLKVIKEIIKELNKYKTDFTVSAEVTCTDSAEKMIKEGRSLARLDKHVLVKVPLTIEGLKAVRQLSLEKIKCNVTLCFSASQALLAAKAGAWCVSPFVGRIGDEGWNGMELIKEIRHVYDNYGFETKILSASIRSAQDIHDIILIGSDIATMPASIFKKLYYNPLTEMGLEKFTQDWKEYKKNLEKGKNKK